MNFQTWLPLLVAAVVFLIRAWFGGETSLWVDEYNWVRQAANPWAEFIKYVRSEGPLGPLDPVLIFGIARRLMNLGIDPHVAMRVVPNVFSVATGLLPFLLSSFSNKERWAWLLWSIFATTFWAVSVNARPYSSLIFFSACAFLGAIHLIRTKTEVGKGFYVILSCLIVASWGHPYVALTSAGLLMVSALRFFILHRDGKIVAALVVALSLTVLWFGVFKTPGFATALDNSVVFTKLIEAPWLAWLDSVLHTFASPGASLKFVLPFALIGVAILARREPLVALYGLGTLAVTFLVPMILNIRYQYFFMPRQAFAGFGAWGLFIVWGALGLLELRKFKAVSVILVGALIGFGGIKPLVHWMKNAPPYVDLPPYRLVQAFRELKIGEDRALIVVSACQLSPARLYADPEESKRFFEAFARREPYDPKPRVRVISWTDKVESCFGNAPALPDRPELLTELQKAPEEFAVFAPRQHETPQVLKVLPCRTEIDSPCVFAE